MPTLKGIPVSPGIALGRALVIGRFESDVPRYQVPPEQFRSELRRFFRARRKAREEIRVLRGQTAESLGPKYAAIFDAHMMILDDRRLGRFVVERIRDQKVNAEWALATSVGRILETMQQVEDPVLRERGFDIQDVYNRLQRVLGGQTNRHDQLLNLEEETIVVAANLSPSDAIWLHQSKIVGFVTETGGSTSHTAILANALEIPAVLGVDNATLVVRDGDQLIVDGLQGQVVAGPTPEAATAYRRRRKAWMRAGQQIEAEAGPVLTKDRCRIRLSANIEFPEEMNTVRRVGAEGIGLYRSEFLFLSVAPHLPTEEDHYEAYSKIAKAALPDRVVIRTLDLGGEKYFHKVLEAGEANPVLGLRAVRFCLFRPDIFRTQLRGLLRVAAENGNVSILVPMVSGIEEWRAVRNFIEEVRRDLEREGLKIPAVPCGPMIEVPSAALVADHLARESDFFSIGTNDLIQYALAVDRNNRRVAGLFDCLHPSVLRLIQRTIEAGRRQGIPVSLCGEMASDPLGALTLLGLGLEEFSCNPLLVPEIRSLLRVVSREDAQAAVRETMELPSGAEIRQELQERFGPILAARQLAKDRPASG